LKLKGFFKLIIVDRFKGVFVILTWIFVNFNCLNHSGIDLLSQLLSMVLQISIIYPIYFVHRILYWKKLIWIKKKNSTNRGLLANGKKYKI
jgi:hypothetical protein